MEDTLILVIILVTIILMLAYSAWLYRLYVKAPTNRAFVRVGGPAPHPPKVVMNGGALVFKFLHTVTWVTLETVMIEIERIGQNALLTGDSQSVDIRAIFYIKVEPTYEGILTAARVFGGEQVDASAIQRVAQPKLEGALGDVVSTFSLMNLYQGREHFIQEMYHRVCGDLQENGLFVESISILTLKATQQAQASAELAPRVE